MKKFLIIALVLFMSFTLVLSACSKDNEEPEATETPATTATETPATTATETPATDPTQMTAEIRIWNYGDTGMIDLFNQKFPNIKVIVESVDDPETKVLVAIAAGSGAPDVFRLNENHYGNLKALAGVENLLLPPYNAGDYQKDFLPAAWEPLTTIDGKGLFAFPWYMTPYVTFYRNDIIEKAGYPSEPEEFGALIADDDKFFDMVAGVKAVNPEAVMFRFIYEEGWMLNTVGFYNHDLVYQRDNDHWVRVLELTKRAVQSGAQTLTDLRGEAQTQATKNGNLVLYFNPASSLQGIIDKAPELEGNWRVTTLPFGEVPARGYGLLAIPSQSVNKEAAWEFIKFVTMDKEAIEYKSLLNRDLSAYLPAKDYEFVANNPEPYLGGQNLFQFMYSIQDKMEFPIGSPFENVSQAIWQDMTRVGLEKNQDARALMTEMRDAIEAKNAQQKAAYLQALGK